MITAAHRAKIIAGKLAVSWWTPEREERLRYYWSAGVPARLIGVRLGATKNSVIGKANRLGLAPRNMPASFRRV